MKISYFKVVDGAVQVAIHSLDVYIPKEYLDLGISELQGNILSTIGIFRFMGQITETDKPVEYILNTPNNLQIVFEEYHEDKVQLKEDDEETAYLVFPFHRGDVFMRSNTIVSSPKTVEKFINLLHSGKLPKTNYESIYRQYMQVQYDNNVIFDVPSSMIEGMISEMTRSAGDLRMPYRMVKNKTGAPGEFTMASLRTIPRLTNTFAALSFEDINAALGTSIVRHRKGQEDITSSPMEAVLSY